MDRLSDDQDSIAAGIAHLRGLDLAGLWVCWHSTLGRVAPAHVPKHLLFRILSYRLQAERLGDLDKDTLRVLDRVGADGGKAAEASSSRMDKSTERPLRPGTILMREWQRTPQRVMVLADGFAWKDKVYASLSEAAFANTGTRWNGPRFFGLRDKPKGVPSETRA